MLSRLSIRDIVLIERLDIDFSPGLSVLTGDDGLLVPFDPLVGTNNEGLFSDAAANPQPSCEPDETGQCPDEEGER